MWRVTAVDPPTSLQFTDAFADADGTPVADMPVSTVRVELTERGGGTRMEMQSAFESREDHGEGGQHGHPRGFARGRQPNGRRARRVTEDRQRWPALYVLCVGMLMIVLDATIVNVALPSIQEDLGFSQNDLAWVVNAYLIAFGGLLLLAGRIGDLSASDGSSSSASGSSSVRPCSAPWHRARAS